MEPTIVAILTAAMLSQPGCMVGKSRAVRVVKAALASERRHRLPQGLLVAIALTESGGRDATGYHRGKGKLGRDVGTWQIHCPGGPSLQQCERRYRPLQANAMRGGYILNLGRKMCRERPRLTWYCRRGGMNWIARYNPRSKAWLIKTLKTFKVLQQALRKRQEPQI